MDDAPVYNEEKANEIITRRVCSRCYGDLTKHVLPDGSAKVFCPRCFGTWCYTTISRKGAEELGRLAALRYNMARLVHRDLFPHLCPPTTKSEQVVLKELGF